MKRLEAKQINGHTYYYYSKWAKVDGKCRRVWQRYLGKVGDIAKAIQGGGPGPLYAEVFEWGLPEVLWNEWCRAEIVAHVDQQCPKRTQGMSIGQYLAIATLNRAIDPQSKRAMWPWFSRTVLLRRISEASAERLSSQQFWNHMDRIDIASCNPNTVICPPKNNRESSRTGCFMPATTRRTGKPPIADSRGATARIESRVIYLHLKIQDASRFYKIILGQGLFGFDAACRRRSHGVWFEVSQSEWETA